MCVGEPIQRGEILDLLSRLFDKSLVVLERAGTEQRRYRLLDTVRDYAAAQLARGQRNCVRARSPLRLVLQSLSRLTTRPSWRPSKCHGLKSCDLKMQPSRGA